MGHTLVRRGYIRAAGLGVFVGMIAAVPDVEAITMVQGKDINVCQIATLSFLTSHTRQLIRHATLLKNAISWGKLVCFQSNKT